MTTRRATNGQFVSTTRRASSTRSTRSRRPKSDSRSVSLPDVGSDRTRKVEIHHRPEGAMQPGDHRTHRITRKDRQTDSRNLGR